MSEDIVKYYVFASLIPPEGQKSGQFGFEFEISKGDFESCQKQIRERKEMIFFVNKETEQPTMMNTRYPVIYVTTRKQRVPSNIIIPDGKNMKIQ